MTIDNKKKAYQVRIRSLLTTLFFTLAIVVVLTSGLFEEALLGLTKFYYTIIIASIYLFISLYFYFLDLNYIFYNDDSDNIVFRYSSLRPWTKTKNSIVIPKKTFAGYTLKKSCFTLKKGLILYQKVNKARAKYPRISISSLNKKEYNKLLHSLQKFAQMK